MRISDWSSDVCSSDLRDNLGSARPCIWVSLRPSDAPPGIALQTVTADPAEGEALTEPGTDIIEAVPMPQAIQARSEEHTSELQSLMRISYAVFCLKKKKIQNKQIK